MAYSLSPRFPSLVDEHVDPGAYYISSCIQRPKENSAPFLSRLPRRTFLGGRIFTDKIYYAEKKHRIVGGASLQDKSPRFQFNTSESSEDDNQEDTCKCESEKCECPLDDEKIQVICQGVVPRNLYKGHVPFTFLGGGQSMPPRGHQGYSILPDGRQQSIPQPLFGPESGEKRETESSAFYRGCKWSHWTSRRADPKRESTPGPADYQPQQVPSQFEVCMDQFRFLKRHNSRQLRYMEMVQLRNILQGGPGPAEYYPKYPKCNDLNKIGPRAPRFSDPLALEVRPGPAAYNLNKPMFKAVAVPQEDDEMSDGCPVLEKNECITPTSAFKSKTMRFKPLIKRLDYPSPADILLQSKKFVKRAATIQRLSPFQSSEGRFRPWHDWMPVHGTEITPGPGIYDITRSQQCGLGGIKMSRASRFPRVRHDGPPPNAYSVDRGIETVRHTFNQRLLKSVNKKDTFKWKPLVTEPKSIRSREAALLAKSIHDLNPDPNVKEFKPKKAEIDIESEIKGGARKIKGGARKPRAPGEPLLLRYFLYDHQFKPC